MTKKEANFLKDDRNFPTYLDWVKESKRFTRKALAQAGVLKVAAVKKTK